MRTTIYASLILIFISLFCCDADPTCDSKVELVAGEDKLTAVELLTGVKRKTYCANRKKICKEEPGQRPTCQCKIGHTIDPNDPNSCLVQKCTDEKENAESWEDFCKAKGERCIEWPGRIPRCECQPGFKRKGLACTAQVCTDKPLGESVTWAEKCLDSKKMCVALQNGPRCLDKYCKPETCGRNALCLYDKTPAPVCKCVEGPYVPVNTTTCAAEKCETWKRKCTAHMLCVVERGLPKCVCKEGYKMVSDKCEYPGCNDLNPLTGKDWYDVCDKPHEICEKHDNKFPTCGCELEFHKIKPNDSCTAKKCSDVRDPKVKPPATWEVYCSKQRHKTICATSETHGAHCVCPDGSKLNEKDECIVKTCEDSIDHNITIWSDHCASQNKLCFAGKTKPPFCVDKNCDSQLNANTNTTWIEHCQKTYNGTCGQDMKGSPQCICEPGFEMKKEGCREKKCPNLMVANGITTCKDILFGGECNVTCNAGYEMLGEEIQTCVVNNVTNQVQWRTKPPTCKVKKCDDLKVDNGDTNCKGITFGNQCKTTCRHGFSLAGEEVQRCILNGTNAEVHWQKEAATCEENWKVICDDLTVIKTLSTKGKCRDAEEDDVCSAWCAAPLKQINAYGKEIPNNPVKLTCTNTTMWGDLPVCKPMCEVKQYLDVCNKYRLQCNSEATDMESLCICGSPYLSWVPERGCVFWESGYKIHLVQFDDETSSGDSEDHNLIIAKQIEKELYNPMIEAFSDQVLGAISVSGCEGEFYEFKCDLELFFPEYVEQSEVKTVLDSFHCDDCTFGNFEFDKNEDDGEANLQALKGACAVNSKLCGRFYDCENDDDLHTGFFCNCEENSLRAVYLPGKMDPDIMVKQVCEDVDECAAQNDCDKSSTTCVNEYGNYSCICRNSFIPSPSQPSNNKFTKCVGVCETNKCGEDGECVVDNARGTYTCRCPNGKTGLQCAEDIDNYAISDKLNKARTTLAVISPVFAVLLIVTLFVSVYTIYRLIRRTKKMTSSQLKLEEAG